MLRALMERYRDECARGMLSQEGWEMREKDSGCPKTIERAARENENERDRTFFSMRYGKLFLGDGESGERCERRTECRAAL